MTINIQMPDNTLTFKRYDINSHRDKLKSGGVYFLYDDEGNLLYIGQTKDFNSRLRSHLRGRDVTETFFRDIAEITIYFVPDKLEREIYETYAINTFNSAYNKGKNYVMLEEKTYEIDEEVERLEDELREIASDFDSDGLVDNTYESDDASSEYATGVYFLNVRRVSEIEEQISELKARKSMTC